MSLFSKLLAGAAGVSAAVIALPASAQSYYPPAPTYTPGYGAQGVVGQVINQVLGGGRYGAYGQGNDRVAVDQCARAVETRVSRDNRRGTYGRWNGGYATNQGYGSALPIQTHVKEAIDRSPVNPSPLVAGVFASRLGRWPSPISP